MYNIFTNRYVLHSGINHWPEFDLIKRTYLRELLKIKDYYNNRVYAIRNNHPLCVLLNNLDVPMSYDDYRYVEIARDRQDYISRNLMFTSETHYGKIHHGVFYGNDCDEIIITVDDYFDINDLSKNWKDYSAVKVLNHPRSDLGFLLPNGKQTSNETGLSVVTINIAALALQFKYFMLEQLRRTDGSFLGIPHFVHMYVLPNMMFSHADIVIKNRLLNLFYGKPMGHSLARHAFPVIDYSDKIDRTLNNVISKIKMSNYIDTDIVNSIPTIINDDMISALEMPDIAPTRQIWWALLLTRLDIMGFIIDVSQGQSSGNKNLMDLRNLQVDLRRLERAHVLENTLSKDLYFNTIVTIDKILNT